MAMVTYTGASHNSHLAALSVVDTIMLMLSGFFLALGVLALVGRLKLGNRP